MSLAVHAAWSPVEMQRLGGSGSSVGFRQISLGFTWLCTVKAITRRPMTTCGRAKCSQARDSARSAMLRATATHALPRCAR